MEKILLVLFAMIALTACDINYEKYPTVIRTGLWEVCLVNDSTLMAVPRNSSGSENKPILFKLNEVETFNKVIEE